MTANARHLAGLSEDQRRDVLSGLSEGDLAALAWSWEFWRQPHQTPPEPPWRVWALIAGRGAGKSWTGAQWVRSEIEAGRRRCIALVAPTHLAGRKVMVETLLRLCPPSAQPQYEMATGVVRWPNGGVCHLLSSETPDRARGFNFDGSWCDELGAWENDRDTWDQLSFATRLPGPYGDSPAIVITTTPRPTRLMRAILADAGTKMTRATTFDNRANLDPDALAGLEKRYAGSRIGRQELLAEMLTDVEGALWSQALLDDHRRDSAPDHLTSVTVGVDPSGGGAAETGIIIAGLGADKHGYIIGDASVKGSPQEWGARAVGAYRLHQANRIVCERNYGGEMCRHVIGSIDRNVPVRLVTASRGKQVRAEPVVSLYEQGRVHHVGHYGVLEDQLTQWDPLGRDPSPDRLDALVWCLTDLMCRSNEWTTQPMWEVIGRLSI